MHVVAALLLLLVVVALVTRRVSATSRAQQTPTGSTFSSPPTPAAIAAPQHRDLICLKGRLRQPQRGAILPPLSLLPPSRSRLLVAHIWKLRPFEFDSPRARRAGHDCRIRFDRARRAAASTAACWRRRSRAAPCRSMYSLEKNDAGLAAASASCWG